MICKVKDTIEKHGLLEKGARVCVALSGGADSVCLLHILSRIKAEYAIILSAVHINHNLRGEAADRDEAFVRCLCDAWEVPLTVYSEDISAMAKERGMGLEECGRAVRYERFSQVHCDLIATAHTLSDSVETMIFNLLRGTGMRGLASIPAKREPNIIRPLIDCTRAEIEAYCSENALEFVTDETNLSDAYTRNYIRHNIVPTFRQVNSSFEESLSRTMDILRLEEDYLRSETAELLRKAETQGGYLCGVLRESHPALRRRAVTEILSRTMEKDVETRHISLLDEAIIRGEGKIQVAKGLYISIKSGIMVVHGEKESYDPIWERQGDSFITPMGSFEIIRIENPERLLPEDIDADKLGNSFDMTPRREGDSFYSLRRRQTKSLKKLFNERKIPVEERDLIPVLRCERGVVWVYTVGTEGSFIADGDTKAVIRIIKKEG